MKDEVPALLAESLGEPVTIDSIQNTGGGCINQTQVLTLKGGRRVFLKYNASPPANMFSAEALGLELLAQTTDGPRIPKVIALQPGEHPHYLILEYLDSTAPGPDFAERFGRALAALHRVTAPSHGLDHDNFIGSTPQINTQETDGLVFFRDHRLGYQQALARRSRLLPAEVDKKLDQLRDRLDRFLDLHHEPPALLHGDLWSGNYFPGPGGTPVMFDPAVYFGPREADLAMTELFGRLPGRFYQAYDEAFPLAPGYGERKDLYNLYHLLNHLNLFGRSYLGSVESIVNAFVR